MKNIKLWADNEHEKIMSQFSPLSPTTNWYIMTPGYKQQRKLYKLLLQKLINLCLYQKFSLQFRLRATETPPPPPRGNFRDKYHLKAYCLRNIFLGVCRNITSTMTGQPCLNIGKSKSSKNAPEKYKTSSLSKLEPHSDLVTTVLCKFCESRHD